MHFSVLIAVLCGFVGGGLAFIPNFQKEKSARSVTPGHGAVRGGKAFVLRAGFPDFSAGVSKNKTKKKKRKAKEKGGPLGGKGGHDYAKGYRARLEAWVAENAEVFEEQEKIHRKQKELAAERRAKARAVIEEKKAFIKKEINHHPEQIERESSPTGSVTVPPVAVSVSLLPSEGKEKKEQTPSEETKKAWKETAERIDSQRKKREASSSSEGTQAPSPTDSLQVPLPDSVSDYSLQTSLVVEADHAERGLFRLDAYIAERLEGLSRSFAGELISSGKVSVDGEVQTKKSHLVTAGERLVVSLNTAEEQLLVGEPIPLEIVYEDSDVLVLNKPPGLVVHPSPGHWNGTLVNALIHRYGGGGQETEGSLVGSGAGAETVFSQYVDEKVRLPVPMNRAMEVAERSVQAGKAGMGGLGDEQRKHGNEEVGFVGEGEEEERQDALALEGLSEEDFAMGDGEEEEEEMEQEEQEALGRLDANVRPGIIHRLDAGTSGLMVVAKTRAATEALQAQFAGGQVNKTYVAITARDPLAKGTAMVSPVGGVGSANGTLMLDVPIGRHPTSRQKMITYPATVTEELSVPDDADEPYEYLMPDGRVIPLPAGRRLAYRWNPSADRYRQRAKEARSLVRGVLSNGRIAAVEVDLLTGRTHQIRVHLSYAGAPVLGDSLYGNADLNKRLSEWVGLLKARRKRGALGDELDRAAFRASREARHGRVESDEFFDDEEGEYGDDDGGPESGIALEQLEDMRGLLATDAGLSVRQERRLEQLMSSSKLKEEKATESRHLRKDAKGKEKEEDGRGGSRWAWLDTTEPEKLRPLLHSARLSFFHPVTGERLSFSARVPDDMAAVLHTISPGWAREAPHWNSNGPVSDQFMADVAKRTTDRERKQMDFDTANFF